MRIQNELKSEKPAKAQDFTENSSKCKSSNINGLARGAGFEPARPLRTTGLAGLDSSKRR